MKNEYRIVRDKHCGYEVQIRRWWFPLWVQCDFVNTHHTIAEAEEYARGHARGPVKYLGRLP